jgi:hypothetical protein
MQIEFIHPELWSIFAGAGLSLMLIFRLVIFKTSFLGRSLICFSAGLALFFVLIFFRFDDLFQVPEIWLTGAFKKTHILNDQEHTVTYYYWYLLVLALAIGSSINIIWLLYDKWRYKWLNSQQQAKIFGLSICLACMLVMLLAVFYTE